jgi:hypothetical protein
MASSVTIINGRGHKYKRTNLNSKNLRQIRQIRENQKRLTNLRVNEICKLKCKDKPSNSKTKIDKCVPTNVHISFRDCNNKDGITQYHYITPCELSVDTLQYAFNTGKVKLVKDKDKHNQEYVSIDNFPTLLVETVTDSNFKDTRRDIGFYSAYEDTTTLGKTTYESQLQDYLDRGVYKNAVKYKETDETDLPDEPDLPETYRDGISIQDINYVREIAKSLITQNPSEYTCDLQGIPDKYIIVETVSSEGDEYVICGYPDPSKMRTYLSMLENPDIQTRIEKIHKKHRTRFVQLFADMHNFAHRDKLEKQINNIEREIYKFMPLSPNMDYLENWYKQNPKLREWINSEEFQEKLRYMDENGLVEHKQIVLSEIEKILIPESEYSAEMEKIELALTEYSRYVNELMLEYLNKPMMRIRYYFLIFKKHSEHGLVPAIFNMKQLEAKHTPVLEKVMDLIQMRIPEIYGILKDSKNHIDSYKLFHNYVKYGDFFYITTEYLHTMSNILHYAHIYKNSISLEELMYASSRMSDEGNPFWNDVKLDYEIKKFRIEIEELQTARGNVSGNMNGGGSINPYAILSVNNNTNLSVNNKSIFNTRKNSTVNQGRNQSNNKRNNQSKKNTLFELINGQILLMYEKTYQEYVIVYKANDEKIWVLEIKSNISKCILEIKAMLSNSDPSSERHIYRCNNSVYRNLEYSGKLFTLLKKYEIDKEFLQNVLKNNPFILKTVTYPKQDKLININEIFKTDLLEFDFSNIEVYNLYYFKPIIYINFLLNQTYLDALVAYKNGKRDFVSKNVKNEYKKTTMKYGVYDNINCIINPNNCGYNFIETYEELKLVVWILPFNGSNYIRNFTFLNREEHLLLLKTMKEYYMKHNDITFAHIAYSYIYGLLHIHRATYNAYKRMFPIEEKGIYILKEIKVNEMINKISTDGKYYNDIKISTLNPNI